MGVRFANNGAPTEYFQRTTGLPSPTSFSACGWVKLVAYNTSGVSFNTIFCLQDGVSTDGILLEFSSGAQTFDFHTTFGGDIVFTNGTFLDDWFHFSMWSNGTGVGSASCTIFRPGVFTETKTGPGGTNVAPGSMTLACLSPLVNGSNCRMAGVKVWDAALTDAELEMERWSLCAIRRTNLHIETPLIDPTAALCAVDLSGNGRDWSVTGSTIEEGPPITYSRRRRMLPSVPAPTLYLTPRQGLYSPSLVRKAWYDPLVGYGPQ